MGFLDSYTPLTNARAGPLLRGFEEVFNKMAHFVHLDAHWVGAMDLTAQPEPWQARPRLALAIECMESARRGAAHRS